MCSFITNFKTDLQEIYRDITNFEDSNGQHDVKIKLVKHSRGKNHKSGDFVIEFSANDAEISEQVKNKLLEIHGRVEKCLKISSVLIITLNRQIVMEQVLRDVLSKKEKYGFNIEIQNLKPNFINFDKYEENSDLTFLRRKLLIQHVKRFVELTEYNVKSSENSDINFNVGKVDVIGGLNSKTNLVECCSRLIERSTAHKFESDEIRHDKLSKMTRACVKFNLLLPNPQRSIKLDLNPDNLLLIKTPAFVMYNFARLSAILDKFDQLVQSSYYPPLIQLEDADLSLLKSEDEWSLIRDYVLWFPCITEEINQSILDSKSIPCFHKLYHFLVNLSHKISAYYTTTHVLGDPTSHLLPLMYSRLHLLKSIFQVMKNCFDILNISPLYKM